MKFLERFIAVPRRFTAAFVLMLTLSGWTLMAAWTNMAEDLGEFLFASLYFFLSAQMAPCLAFALLKERGLSVSAPKRAAFHAAPILLSAVYWYWLDNIKNWNTLVTPDPFGMSLVACTAVGIALTAVPLVADGIYKGIKALPAFLDRSLLSAVMALLASTITLFLGAEIFPGLRYNGIAEDLTLLIYIYIAFPWLFMMGIPDAPHQSAPIQRSSDD